MAATFNITLKYTRDYMRLACADFDGLSGSTVIKPILQDETYDGLAASFPYSEALAQAATAILVELARDPTIYTDRTTDSEYNFTQRMKSLRDLVEDCRAGLVQAPGGLVRTGTAVDQMTTVPICPPNLCEFRTT